MKQTLKLVGMSCASCAQTIEKAVSQVSGVNQANVNFASETLNVEVVNEAVLSDVILAVKESGYDVKQTETKLLTISGMSCVSCAQTIEKAVSVIEGVVSANVNFATGKLFVEYTTPFNDVLISEAVKEAGYAVEQSAVVEDTQDNAFKSRVIWSVALTIPLLYIAMGHMFGAPVPSILHNPLYMALAQLVLSIPIAWINRVYYVRGFKSLIKKHPNMDTLVALGTSAAFLQGFYALTHIAQGHHMPVYFESGAVILMLITVGKYIEHLSKKQTTTAIKALVDLAPKMATVLENGQEIVKPVEMVQPGNILVTKVGESIALDGVMLSGNAQVDESMLTGESKGVTKTVGEEVIGGSLLINGSLTYRVTRVGEDTALSQIIKLVEEAQGSKAPIAKLADTISGYFVPVVIVIAIATFIGWLLLGHPITTALNMTISVLVIACPCALGLATPTAIMVGTGKGAKQGILIKNGEALEQLHHIDTVVLDKTGTITKGEPTIVDVDAIIPETALFELVGAIEQHSTHPIAKSLMVRVVQPTLSVENFTVVDGQGVEGIVGGKLVQIGNEKLTNDAQWLEKATVLSGQGKTTLFVAVDKAVVGLIAVADVVKESSAEAIKTLKHNGIDVVMLTGDNDQVAHYIAKQVGIDTVYSQVLPQDKVSVVTQLQDSGKKVAMVGDGINDAPTLAKADVGIAIGAGTQVAIESADIVLVKSDLKDVSSAIRLSHQTIQTIKQNLFWAFAYNVLCVPIAMGLFYPNFVLDPMLAGLAMGFSSVSVVINALILNLRK